MATSKTRFLFTAAVAQVTFALALAPSAQAQSSAASQSASDSQVSAGDIIVTARREAERLNDVPTSITAITAENLEERHITDLRGVTYSTPGLLSRDFGAGILSTPIIRGMTQANNGGADGSVSVFVDGVYIANNNSIDVAMINLERVEVVRGPQSALYGRNAFSGAINYVTRMPGDTFEGRITATGGNYSRYGVNGSLSGPVVDGILSLGVAAMYDSFDGSYKDRVTGARSNGFKKRAGQLTATFTPSSTIRIPMGITYSHNIFDPVAQVEIRNCGTVYRPPVTAPAFVQAFAGPTYFCGPAPNGDKISIQQRKVGYSDSPNNIKTLSVNIRPSFELPFGNLDLIAAHTHINRYGYGSLDHKRLGAPVLLFPSNVWQTVPFANGALAIDDDLSLEARYSTPKDKIIRAQIGGFYYRLNRKNIGYFGYDCSGVPAGQTSSSLGFAFWCNNGGGPVGSAASTVRVKQRSAFGSLEVDPLEGLKLRGDLRYTSEYKNQNQTAGLFPTLRPLGLSQDTFKFWDYKINAQYFLSRDTNVYANVGTGHRAGGFNQTAMNPVDLPYSPEKNVTYEVGLKSSFLDNRLSAAFSAYYIDWTQIQLNSLPTPPALQTGSTVIKNFGAARVKGFELSLDARPTDTLTLNAGFAYADPEFKSSRAYDVSNSAQCLAIPSCAGRVGWLDPATRRITFTPTGNVRAVALDGRTVYQAAKWLINLSADQTFTLGNDMSLSVRADYRFESKRYGTIINVNEIPARNLVNGRVTLRKGDYELAFWMDNIFDDRTPIQIGLISQPGIGVNPLTTIYGDKRTFGVTGSMRF